MLKAKAKQAARRITVGEDKAYDTADHVAHLRAINVTPHVTQNEAITSTGKRRRSAIDARTTRHQGYGMSQSRRAMIECIFGSGQAAWHHAQDQTSRHRQCRCRLPAQPDCLQPDPHPETGRGVDNQAPGAPKPPSKNNLTASPQKSEQRLIQGFSADC
jgi:hypothetical protein